MELAIIARISGTRRTPSCTLSRGHALLDARYQPVDPSVVLTVSAKPKKRAVLLEGLGGVLGRSRQKISQCQPRRPVARIQLDRLAQLALGLLLVLLVKCHQPERQVRFGEERSVYHRLLRRLPRFFRRACRQPPSRQRAFGKRAIPGARGVVRQPRLLLASPALVAGKR